MFVAMRRLSKQFKIFWSIIVFESIDVVNNLMLFEQSSKFCFHHKAMFSNISIR